MLNIADFLINIISYLFGTLLILRFWIKKANVPIHHPVAQNIFQLTQWIVLPLSRILPKNTQTDWASLLGLYLYALLYCLLYMLIISKVNLSLNLITYLLLPALFIALKWALTLAGWIIIIQTLLSWIATQTPMMSFLSMLCAPLLNPIRKHLNLNSGFDLSPLFAFIIIQVLKMILLQSLATLSPLSLHFY